MGRERSRERRRGERGKRMLHLSEMACHMEHLGNELSGEWFFTWEFR